MNGQNQSLDGVQTIDHQQLDDLLLYHDRTGDSLMVHGTVGIGKSQKIEEYAKESSGDRTFLDWDEATDEEKEDAVENPGDYFIYKDVRLSSYDPSDMKGIPDLDDNLDDGLSWEPPIWVIALAQQNADGLVFLDEVNLAPQQVQKAFYKLVNKQRVGEYSLNSDVLVVGAGNVAGEDRANIHEFPAPLRNRFDHVELAVPDGGKDGLWTEHAIENDFHELVISYCGSPAGAEALFTFTDEEKDSYAYATPRTWERVSRLLKQMEQDGRLDDYDLMERMVASVIGQNNAKNFRGFVELREEIDFKKFLTSPESATELNSKRIDLQRSVMTGLASEYKANTDHFEAIIKVADAIERTELGTLMLRLCREYHPNKFEEQLFDTEIPEETVERYAKLLKPEDEG